MVIDNLVSKTVFLDTAPLIYYIEGNERYKKVLKKLFDLNDKGQINFVTTTITLLEKIISE